MNIVASDSVNGKMTLSLKDVPWDQALDLVMQARNLDMRQQGNIVNIAPRDELLAKDKAFLQAEKDIADLGALYSQNFQLKYKMWKNSAASCVWTMPTRPETATRLSAAGAAC